MTDNWISVKDLLPKLGSVILVWRGDGYSVCRYTESRNNWRFQKRKVFINVFSHSFICDDVTHWMYFPKPPKNQI